jgi:predicted DCC family thiol-disulfide oxidoreductase YuxK
MQTPQATTVYYNSACPICNAGIAVQKQKMQGCSIEWIDVHLDPAAASAVSSNLETVRKRLHVRSPTGELAIGIDAMDVLWAQTPGQRILSKLSKLPILHALLAHAYNGFAHLLYRWNRWKKHW